MSKRFTDSKKWRNEWFRKLTPEAKLTWIYLCDECEFHGVMKIDYGLASFQLGFEVNSIKIKQFFNEKVYFIDDEKILIVQFFEFQYGESKDSWSAKVKAKEKLENIGFSFINDSLQVDYNDEYKVIVDHSSPTVGDSGTTVLIKGKVKGIVKVNNNKEIVKNEKIEIDLGIKKVSVNKTLIESWSATYPKEFLEIELKKARNWLLSNTHKSPKKDLVRFLNNWFSSGWEQYRKTLKSNPTTNTVDELMSFMGWEKDNGI